jgi:hypothetical protein
VLLREKLKQVSNEDYFEIKHNDMELFSSKKGVSAGQKETFST